VCGENEDNDRLEYSVGANWAWRCVRKPVMGKLSRIRTDSISNQIAVPKN
jgi:hypothetical protein